jgi:ABC-type dipeptide/oligopeptide/nickel transport system permease component
VTTATVDLPSPAANTTAGLSTFWQANRWWVQRLLALPVNILVFAICVFFLAKAVPGDPVALSSGGYISTAQAEKIKEGLGLTLPWWHQLLIFLWSTVRLQFGTGIVDGTPVIQQIAQRLPTSLELVVIGLVFTFAVAMSLSLIASLWPTSVLSRMIRFIGHSAGALPDFTIGVLAIFVFYAKLRLAPAPVGLMSPLINPPPRITGFPLIDAALSGQGPAFTSILAHTWLPELVLVVAFVPVLLKVLVITTDEATASASVRFRVSVGERRNRVLRAIMRQALPTTVANLANLAGLLIGGTIVIEQLFSLGGMGQYAVTGVTNADYRVVQGFLIIYAVICMVIFLISDIVVRLLDPRRRTSVDLTSS